MKKTKAPTYVIMDEQPKIDDKIVIIKNMLTEEILEVGIVRDNRGNQTYTNLPPEIEAFMYNYSNDEIYDNFL